MSFIASSPIGVPATTTIRRSRVVGGVVTGAPVAYGTTLGGASTRVVSGSYGTGLVSERVVGGSYGTGLVSGGVVGGSYGTGLVSGGLVSGGVVGGSYGTGLVGSTYGTGIVGSGVVGTSYGTGLATSGLAVPAPIYNKAVIEEIPTESRIEYVPYEKR